MPVTPFLAGIRFDSARICARWTVSGSLAACSLQPRLTYFARVVAHRCSESLADRDAKEEVVSGNECAASIKYELVLDTEGSNMWVHY